MLARLAMVGLFACAALLAACAGDDGPPASRLPNVHFEVALAGSPEQPAPLEVLESLIPSFASEGQRAWRLSELFRRLRGNQAARVEVHQADGTRTGVPAPFREVDGQVWVLRADERGEAQVSCVDPARPFAAPPGQRRSSRPVGTPGVLRNVSRIRLIVDPSTGGTGSAPPMDLDAQVDALLTLVVTVDGIDRVLDADDVAGLEPIVIQGDDGKGTRDAWNLRALVRAIAGLEARIAALHGRGGRMLELSAQDWARAGREPVLRLNRRAELKFHWVGADGTPQPGGELREVARLEITSR